MTRSTVQRQDDGLPTGVGVTSEASSVQGSVLLLSQRRIANLVAYCLAYEFEDTFAAVTGAERIDAIDLSGLEFSRRAYRLARMAVRSRALARTLTPYPRNRVTLRRDFDLFFPVFSHTHELYALAMVPDWRKRCRKAACFITEVWSDLLPEYLVELLAEFDHVFLGFPHSVPDVARIIGRPCTYLPLAADVLGFAPEWGEQSRCIDVCNIGRRSDITHEALLARAAKDSDFFYYYDTVAASGSDLKQRTFRVDSPSEHRRMLAALLKRSRYYFANRSRVNEPEFTVGREEISARFYEGAASGTVMIGEAPRSSEFLQQFDWPDAVVHVPFNSPDIGDLLDDMNASPDRLRAIRHTNVRQAALRHDWLHRIQTVFESLGLVPTPAMRARAQRLEEIASRASR